jgi:hypothetical protein
LCVGVLLSAGGDAGPSHRIPIAPSFEITSTVTLSGLVRRQDDEWVHSAMMQSVAKDMRGRVLLDSGHWINEEQFDTLLRELLALLP